MYHVIIEVGYIKYLCYKLFIVYPETQSWCLDCIFLVTLSQRSSTFPFGEVEAGLKTEMMDGESFWYYLIRPPATHSSLAYRDPGVDRSPLGDRHRASLLSGY